MPNSDPDPRSFAAFLRVIATRNIGAPFSVNAARDDLTTAQIPRSAWGACFRAATEAGYLTTTGMTTRSNDPTARGRRCLVYRIARRPRKTAA